MGNLRNVYTSLGNSVKAIEYHQQSLTIARNVHNCQKWRAKHD
ncbi:MAG: tetratricopeptide repeat-containing protein [Microcoleus vaginatus WJT46-NPBG5]|nr:tetratricopeptide repeat-containing protein [Microcoleus vaginatus WJT46-NPBG5]